MCPRCVLLSYMSITVFSKILPHLQAFFRCVIYETFHRFMLLRILIWPLSKTTKVFSSFLTIRQVVGGSLPSSPQMACIVTLGRIPEYV